jgi:DNA primase
MTSPSLAGEFWKSGKSNREYWYNRLLTDNTIDKFSLGYYDGWYTVPVFSGSELINIQLRRDLPQKRIKMWYKGQPLSLFNENILKYTDYVYFTEGLVDAILLSQLGYPCVSKLGGNMSWYKNWFSKFINQNIIYYVADNDIAGIEGAKLVSEMLGLYRTKIVLFEGFKEKYDSVDFFRNGGTKEEFDKLVSNSKFSFELE